MFFDGLGRVTGAGTCEAAAETYRDMIEARLAETGGVSPVAIQSQMEVAGSMCTVSATYRRIDPVELTNLRATFFVYEDSVYWCCGYDSSYVWNGTTRAIYSEDVVLAAPETEAFVEHSFPIPAEWNPDQLGAVVLLQDTVTKEVYQGQLAGNAVPLDFSLWFEQRQLSVPDGNGTAIFNALLTNIGETQDTFTLETGVTFGDWSTEFYVCGDSNPHTDPLDVVLQPDESCPVEIHVGTNDAVELRSGSFVVTSSLTGRVQETNLTIFNGSYAILFVDDDRTHTEDIVLRNALDNLGVLYVAWDVDGDHGGNSPSPVVVAPYDIVIWHTSPWPQNWPLTDSDVSMLMGFMDGGGSLFLTSQQFLNTPNGPESFRIDYLGVASYSLDHNYLDVEGVPGDPIGDGLVLPLSFPFNSLAKGDHVEPSATATACILGPNGENTTVANLMESGAKAVFMAFPFDAISESDPDPNNATVVMGRILDWIEPSVPAAAEDEAGPRLVSRIEEVSPNPFNPRTTISLFLSPAGSVDPVRVGVFDLQGRHVAGLIDGRLDPGIHTCTWDGRSRTGRQLGSGVYFLRLETGEGVQGQRLLLLK